MSNEKEDKNKNEPDPGEMKVEGSDSVSTDAVAAKSLIEDTLMDLPGIIFKVKPCTEKHFIYSIESQDTSMPQIFWQKYNSSLGL